MTPEQLAAIRQRLKYTLVGSDGLAFLAQRDRDAVSLLGETERLERLLLLRDKQFTDVLEEMGRLKALVRREHGMRCLDNLDNGKSCAVCADVGEAP